MVMDNGQTIIELYEALKRRDGPAMGALYHPDATFRDPVFGQLSRADVVSMWHMLCVRGHDLELELVRSGVNGDRGFAEWEARYAFAKTGKKVHNKVLSQFVFRDGLIYDQVDEFDLWRWLRMALGAPGRLLGWARPLRNAVRKEALRNLQAFRDQAARSDR